MPEQYFQRDEDKYRAARKFRFVFEARTEFVPDENARKGNCKCYDADKADGFHKADAEEGKRNAHGERVYARGDGKHEILFQIQLVRVLLFLIVFFERFRYHLYTDYGKQDESYPVVYGCYVFFKLFSEQVAYRRHQRLKASEKKREYQRVFIVHFAHIQPFAYRNGECVHGKSDRKQDQLYRTQNLSILSIFYIMSHYDITNAAVCQQKFVMAVKKAKIGRGTALCRFYTRVLNAVCPYFA